MVLFPADLFDGHVGQNLARTDLDITLNDRALARKGLLCFNPVVPQLTSDMIKEEGERNRTIERERRPDT